MGVFDINGNAISTGGAFISVKDFGATGNGTANDSTAIQRAFDSVRVTGGVIYFPEGSYNLETAVQFYSNTILLFELGAVLIQGASINNLMRSFCDSSWTEYNGTHDVIICGATFDGTDYTTNNTLVGLAHCKNIVFENCTFRNAYGEWHDLEINSSYNVKVINCIFEGARKTTERSELIQIDSAYDSSAYPWNINSDNTVCEDIEISGCLFYNSMAPGIGQHSSSVHDFVKIHDNHFRDITTARGAVSLSGAINVDIYNNSFDTCACGVGSGDTTWFIHGNRFVDVTTAISSNSGVSHSNMINGTYTA